MIRLLTGQDMLELEKKLFAQGLIQQEQLMDYVCEQISLKLIEQRSADDQEVVFLVGPGNNGADALKVAQLICSSAKKVSILYFGSAASSLRDKKEKEFKKFISQKKRKVEFHHLPKLGDVKLKSWLSEHFGKATVVVDGIFGAGFSRQLQESFVGAIQYFNDSKALRIALDIPTGLDSADGLINPIAFKADITYTSFRPKPGFFVNHGPHSVGKIRVIGFGDRIELLHGKFAGQIRRFLFNRKDLSRNFPRRGTEQHKASFGKVLVVGGSNGMEGAACLAGLAAARIGAGYVSICSPSSEIRKFAPPDFLWTDWKELKDQLHRFDVVIFGPGIGRGPEAKEALEILQSFPHVVCDADGLNALAESKIKIPSSWILTPHAGELSRLIKKDSKDIEAHRWVSAEEATKKFGCVVLLKGFRTLVSSYHRNTNGRLTKKINQAVISTGNVALAKAGTGDVLSGFIGGLLAQQLSPTMAALTAATYHGHLADQWVASGKGNWSLMASDLLLD